MTEKRTVLDLIAGQEYELRTPRGMRISYPQGKTSPKVIVARDLGTWVPAPTPEPEPEPEPEPTPLPGTPVPSNIDKTGATDASAALNAWIGGLPNGSTVAFPADGVYRLDGQGLVITGKTGLTLNGNGATLRAYGDPASNRSAAICLYGADANIVVRDFKLVGNGTGLYKSGGSYENQHGVCSFGTKGLEVAGCTITNTWGDGVYVTNSELGNNVYPPSEDVNIHDNAFAAIGRMGVAVISAKRVTVERNSFDRMSLDVLDIEPDWAAPRNVVEGITFRDNTIGSYAHSDLYRSHVLAITGSSTPVKDITVDANVVNAGRVVNAKNDAAGVTAAVWDKGSRRVNIRFTNNRSTTSGPRYSLTFQAVDTLVITGNAQPVAAPPLAYIENCTGVVKDF